VARTARINTVRGLLREFGIVIPLGAKRVIPRIQELLEEAESGLPDSTRPALSEARSEILELERRIRSVEDELRGLARQLPVVQKLCSIPGIGLITSTALFAFVGDVQRFPSARHVAR
jgi:transposase